MENDIFLYMRISIIIDIIKKSSKYFYKNQERINRIKMNFIKKK